MGALKNGIDFAHLVLHLQETLDSLKIADDLALPVGSAVNDQITSPPVLEARKQKRAARKGTA